MGTVKQGRECMLDYERFKLINDLFMAGRAEEARHHLMEMQSRCIALRDEMTTLRTQVQEFEDIIFLSKSLHFDRQFYWIKIANMRQGPFCPQCYDRDGTLMRLESRRNMLLCPYCGAEHLRAVACALEQPHGHALDDHSCEEHGLSPHPRQARVIPFAR